MIKQMLFDGVLHDLAFFDDTLDFTYEKRADTHYQKSVYLDRVVTVMLFDVLSFRIKESLR